MYLFVYLSVCLFIYFAKMLAISLAGRNTVNIMQPCGEYRQFLQRRDKEVKQLSNSMIDSQNAA